MKTRWLLWGVAAVAFTAGSLGAAPAGSLAVPPRPAAAPVDERAVHDLAAQLRCVVCQTLSVADSPSETANQMRQIIRERLAAGDSVEQVRAYFVARYGEWILLAPPKSGFNLLVWVVPFVGLGLGLLVVILVLRQWSRNIPTATRPALDPALRARIRREVADGDNL